MAFSPEALKTARESGYSDDEIFGHLATTDPRFAKAKEAGYALDEVAAHFAQQVASSPATVAAPQSTSAGDATMQSEPAPSESVSEAPPADSAPEYKSPWWSESGAKFNRGNAPEKAADLGRRVGASVAENTADAATGFLQAADDFTDTPVVMLKGKPFLASNATEYGALNEQLQDTLDYQARTTEGGGGMPDPQEIRLRERMKELEANPTKKRTLEEAAQFMRDVSERAKEDYKVNPEFDADISSKVAGGVGSIIPALASGPMAPLTVAGMMAEQGRKDAETSGATPEQQKQAFYLSAGVGVLSEALMGIPALLRSARAAKLKPATYKALVKAATTQAAKSFVREGSQEAIEQAAQNTIANAIVGYDAERGTFDGVPEAFFIGGMVGAPVGGVVQTAQDLPSVRRAASEQRASTTPALPAAAVETPAQKAQREQWERDEATAITAYNDAIAAADNMVKVASDPETLKVSPLAAQAELESAEALKVEAAEKFKRFAAAQKAKADAAAAEATPEIRPSAETPTAAETPSQPTQEQAAPIAPVKSATAGDVGKELIDKITPLFSELAARRERALEKQRLGKELGVPEMEEEGRSEANAIGDEMIDRFGTESQLRVNEVVADRLKAGTHEWVEGHGLRKAETPSPAEPKQEAPSAQAESSSTPKPIEETLPPDSMQAIQAHNEKFVDATGRIPSSKLKEYYTTPYAVGKDYGLPVFVATVKNTPIGITYEEFGGIHKKVKLGQRVYHVMMSPDGGIHFSADGSLAMTGEGAFKTMRELAPVFDEILGIALNKNPDRVFQIEATDTRRIGFFKRYAKRAGFEVEGNTFRKPINSEKPATPAPEAPISSAEVATPLPDAQAKTQTQAEPEPAKADSAAAVETPAPAGNRVVKRPIAELEAEMNRLNELITDEASYEAYSKARNEFNRAKEIEKYGSPRLTWEEQDAATEPLEKLNFGVDASKQWKKGEKIRDDADLGGVFKTSGAGVLFRGVSVEDYARIQKQGFLDTDGRGVISKSEEINLAPHTRTAVTYIPNGQSGVVLAIDPSGLDLFRIGADDYVRAKGRIPASKIVAVSPEFTKGESGESYLKNPVAAPGPQSVPPSAATGAAARIEIREFNDKGRLSKKVTLPPEEAARILRGRESMLSKLLECVGRL